MLKSANTEQTTNNQITLGTKDLAILKILQQNAKATVKEIAQQIHLSTTPVHERIKRLEQLGVIKQYATLLDFAKVKKSLMVFCYVSLKEHSKNAGTKFIKHIQSLPEVIECYNISGEFDFMLKVVAENMDDYYHFHVNKLSQSENIANVQSVFVMGTIKQTHVII